VFAISMVTLRPGAMGGSETYARSLVGALGEGGTLPYVCLVPADARDAAGGLRAVGMPAPHGSAARRAAALTRLASRRVRVAGVRAVHYPFTIPVPRLGLPFAITLHDLLHRDVPKAGPHWLRAFRAVAYDRPAQRADAVIVPSEYVRRRASEALGVADERLVVVPHGIDHMRFRPGAEGREPFLLYPARAWPHKNHERLLEAFALVRHDRPDLRLVLTGVGEAWRRPAPGVETRGLLGAEELAPLYRRAAALVFPSLHEGFGQPPLEAMACGCPVACSRTTSLPEVCGDAAEYFDPLVPSDIADGVFRALARADELARRGLERARQFTWERSARAHEAVYERLLGTASA
jgi:glycosyltransferase involved in cell wall biosynthesis